MANTLDFSTYISVVENNRAVGIVNIGRNASAFSPEFQRGWEIVSKAKRKPRVSD